MHAVSDNNQGRLFHQITSVKKVLFSPVSVRLSVCLSANRSSQKLLSLNPYEIFLERLDIIQRPAIRF